MAIGVDSLIEVSNVGTAFSAQVRNVWQYRVESTVFGLTSASLAEAWWNHVKTVMRAFPTVAYAELYQSIEVRELNNPTGDYGTYAVPSGEWAGTRANPTQADTLPPFCAGSIRLTVGTRLTRPGSKRFVGLVEGDQVGGILHGATITLLNNIGNVVTAPIVLGAPAATVSLTPIIVKKGAGGSVLAHQEITGYLASNRVTTQNTRKFFKGI